MSDIPEQKERESKLELLRIISMILIVMSHSDDWMELAGTYGSTVCVNKFITDWLNLGGQIGVGCFLLISGYFMVDQKFKLKKIFRLLGEVWFYTLSIQGIYVLSKIATGGEFVFSYDSFIETLSVFFPVLFSYYWFVTAYIILMFLSPFFNKLILVMDKRMYQMLLATLIVIFVVLEGGLPVLLNGMSEGRLIPVFIMYFIAGYIKRYVDSGKANSKKHLVIAISAYLLLYASAVGFGIIGALLDSGRLIDCCYIWRPLNSPIVLVINVELFLAFLKMKSIRSRLINSIASNTFGVYLIHTNGIILGMVLPRIFPIYKETNSIRLLLYSIGSVATVYAACTVIDMIRQKTVEKLWLKLLDARYDRFEQNIKRQIALISGKVISVLKKYYG